MRILFNKKFLQHNPGSYAEGPYRIEGFAPEFEAGRQADGTNIIEADVNGEEYITLVHSESHLELVRKACMESRVLAEVYLSPGAPCQA